MLWNSLLLGAGIFASRNLGMILEMIGRANAWLLALAALLIGAIVYWWIRSRRDRDDEGQRSDDDVAGETEE